MFLLCKHVRLTVFLINWWWWWWWWWTNGRTAQSVATTLCIARLALHRIITSVRSVSLFRALRVSPRHQQKFHWGEVSHGEETFVTSLLVRPLRRYAAAFQTTDEQTDRQTSPSRKVRLWQELKIVRSGRCSYVSTAFARCRGGSTLQCAATGYTMSCFALLLSCI